MTGIILFTVTVLPYFFHCEIHAYYSLIQSARITRSSAIAEGLREALVSRNHVTTKHHT